MFNVTQRGANDLAVSTDYDCCSDCYLLLHTATNCSYYKTTITTVALLLVRDLSVGRVACCRQVVKTSSGDNMR
jgi:hypothetical protein